MDKSANIKYKLLKVIFATLGFQQVFVINIGGSFKIYELIALILLFFFISNTNNWRVKTIESFFLFLSFVLSPILSLLLFYSYQHDLNKYFEINPVADNLRYDPNYAPIIILFYFILCWISFNEILKSKLLYVNTLRIMKIAVNSATFIALYSIYSCIFSGYFGFPDLIMQLPDLLQRKGSQIDFGIRSVGFSQEPSFYVFFQSWIVIILYSLKSNLYPKKYRASVFLINLISLILTFSTALIGLLASLLLCYFLFSRFADFLKLVGILILTLLFLKLISTELGIFDLVSYYFIDKAQNFFSYPTHTLDSGSFRAYTSVLGFEIFKDYPIFGVGPGSSIYFMHQFESHIPLDITGIQLGIGEVPQSSFSKVLAEQGLFGFIPFILFMGSTLRKLYQPAKLDKLARVFFLGATFTFIMLFSIQPQYSIFIWVFVAFGLNRVLYTTPTKCGIVSRPSLIAKD